MPSLTLLQNQGLSNTNYLLKTAKKSYVIKAFGPLHVDRKLEFKVQKEAYKKKVGAKPIYLNDSLMICEYLEGFHKFKLKNRDIKNIASVLQKLHQIKIGKKLFNHKKDFVLCHHDLNPKNIIFSKNIKLIDWEYAYIDNRYFDLATISVEFKLSKQKEKLLLNSYFKNPYDVDRKKLNLFKKKYIDICIEWLKQKSQL